MLRRAHDRHRDLRARTPAAATPAPSPATEKGRQSVTITQPRSAKHAGPGSRPRRRSAQGHREPLVRPASPASATAKPSRLHARRSHGRANPHDPAGHATTATHPAAVKSPSATRRDREFFLDLDSCYPSAHSDCVILEMPVEIGPGGQCPIRPKSAGDISWTKI